MSRRSLIFLIVSFALLYFGIVQAQPAPSLLIGPQSPSAPASLRGHGFGPSPDIPTSPGIVEAIGDLRTCLVYSDTIELTPESQLEIGRLVFWRDDYIVFSVNTELSITADCLYLRVIDAQGAISLPVGPVTLEDGRLRLAPGTVPLAEGSHELAAAGAVNMLVPKGEMANDGCLGVEMVGGPGRPGQPGRPIQWN